MSRLSHVHALWLVFLLAACTTLPTPQSLAERLLYVDAQVTATGMAIADLYDAGSIDAEEHSKLFQVWKAADTAMSTAWVANGAGDLDTVQSQLQLATRLLVEIRQRLPQ